MLEILSQEIEKKKDPFNRGHEKYEFAFQLHLEKDDPAFVEGGTQLYVLYDKKQNDISSYAFQPKNNPRKPTISVSLKDEERILIIKHCRNLLKETGGLE